jgi:two-component system, chemotaxis family, protein-glutamate methylesterase/glutaminase
MNTPSRQIVVIGASAGGLEILRSLLGAIPADFSAPIALVLHTSPESPDILHEILDRAGEMRCFR